MGNACINTCYKKTIISNKRELDVEDIFKNIQSDNKKSQFNVNKKTYKSVLPNKSNNKLNSNNFESEDNINSFRGNNGFSSFNRKPKKMNSKLSLIRKNNNSFRYTNSDNSRGSFDNNKISNKNTLNKKHLNELNNSDSENIYCIDNRKKEKLEKISLKLVEEINLVRKNCLEYTKKIHKYNNLIVTENDEHYILSRHEDFEAKSCLFRGKIAFEEIIKILEEEYKEMIIKNSFLEKLEFVEDLKIPFPYDDMEKSTKYSYIKPKFKELKEKFEGKYDITDYHFDLTYNDPEFSTVMQIVDDNNAKNRRRKNILNKENKYIGINCAEMSKDRIIIYYVFAR